MTLRKIVITAAITTVAMLGTIGSASAGKEQWERNKPHVNVGITAMMVKEALRTGNSSTQDAPIEPELIVRKKDLFIQIY